MPLIWTTFFFVIKDFIIDKLLCAGCQLWTLGCNCNSVFQIEEPLTRLVPKYNSLNTYASVKQTYLVLSNYLRVQCAFSVNIVHRVKCTH